jgi:hypothetical protein
VSVIDTESNHLAGTIKVGSNPNDMKLSNDGRLFVACSNDNTVHVIDTVTRRKVEVISTTISAQAPEGSTPDALAIDQARHLLFVANADNNDVAVVNIADPKQSEVAGFIPTGWYPSALALSRDGRRLFVGNSKGEAGHADLKGPGSPLASRWDSDESVKTLQKGSIEFVDIANLRKQLPVYTKQVIANSPYNDSQLTVARRTKMPSVIPSAVGAGSPIQHVIYIIKENRTYDQVFGDITKGNGDVRLTIFGQRTTPNQHALAGQFVLLDNCTVTERSALTDTLGRTRPMRQTLTNAFGHRRTPALATRSLRVPISQARAIYGTWRGGRVLCIAVTASTPHAQATVLRWKARTRYSDMSRTLYHASLKARDPDNVGVFIQEFDEYEKNIDNPSPEKRLPNYIVMSLPEDHTRGTQPGAFTPVAMVASNDYAVGKLVDRVTHSKYWPTTAIFIIEDDAQDGPDHVDARRTTGLVISPYVRRGTVDSTMYSTSSMVRSIELLLGLPPMSQYDAAAMPMYASFGTEPDLSTFSVIQLKVDLNTRNTKES